jgi:hypothetical protein
LILTQLLPHDEQIFSANPSHEIFRRSWAPDAVFEDPLCYAKGERQFKAQFWGLVAAFSKCELLAWHATKDEPNQVNYVQRQRYTFKGLGFSKEMLSTISMKLNDQGKIIHMQDRWNHQDPPANFIAWPLRRLNAVSLPYLISVPPEKGSKPARTEL